jgi:hypothetical protein
MATSSANSSFRAACGVHRWSSCSVDQKAAMNHQNTWHDCWPRTVLRPSHKRTSAHLGSMTSWPASRPVRLRLLFEPALSDVQAVARAAIPVDNIRADVLIISGTDDQMGPSDIAGDSLLEKLVRAAHQGRRLHLRYPEAGHLIGIPFTPTTLRLTPWRFAVGGNVRGYARADADSWPQVLQFLRTSLGASQ